MPRESKAPKALKPILATLIDAPFDSGDWVFETKWDGFRLVARIEKGSVTLYSRGGLIVSDKYKPRSFSRCSPAKNARCTTTAAVTSPVSRTMFNASRRQTRSCCAFQRGGTTCRPFSRVGLIASGCQGSRFTTRRRAARSGAVLTNIRKVAVVTTYNAPWWFIRLYMEEPDRKVLMRGFTRLIASGARTQFLAHYDMLRSTDVSRKRFLERVDETFKSF
jgi:hypothetical protein